MKAYTDLEQSKKLAEILPLESADMFYADLLVDGVHKYNLHPLESYGFKTFEDTKLKASDHLGFVPCWSLAALLDVLPFHLIVDNQRYAFSIIKGLDKNSETYAIKYAIFNTTFYFHLTDFYNNPVDACYEMIIKLHEQKLL